MNASRAALAFGKFHVVFVEFANQFRRPQIVEFAKFVRKIDFVFHQPSLRMPMAYRISLM